MDIIIRSTSSLRQWHKWKKSTLLPLEKGKKIMRYCNTLLSGNVEQLIQESSNSPALHTYEESNSRRTRPARNMPYWFWNDTSVQHSFLQNLAKELNIIDQSGWYKISASLLQRHGLLQKYNGSVSKLLSTIFPEYPSPQL